MRIDGSLVPKLELGNEAGWRKPPAKPHAANGVIRLTSHQSVDGLPNRSTDPPSLVKPPPPKDAPPPPVDGEQPVPKSASTAPPDGVRRIDLSTSLALVAGQNPQVGFVQQQVQEALADLDLAETFWLPSLRAGVHYNKHEGSFQDVAGTAFNVSRGSLFTGFGSLVPGAGSPAIPGLFTRFHLADAIFQPLIAERQLSAGQYAVSETTNNLLLDAAVAYVELQLAVERKRVAEEILAELKKLSDLTESFAKRGQIASADADRARTELELQRNEVTRAIEQIQKASARLAEMLNLDQEMELWPAEPTILQVELVVSTADLTSLINRGVANRPEMSRNAMEISAACERFRRERYSPYIPHVGAGMSYGGFGAGVGDTITHFKDRFDVDAFVFWEVRNLGFGERAARDAAGARVHQSQYQRAVLANRVRREVKVAYAELLSAKKQIEQAETSLKAAEASYRKNEQRIRNVQGLPIEVLQSIRALDAAKRERVNAAAAYNRAQFRLHYAIGWPANP